MAKKKQVDLTTWTTKEGKVIPIKEMTNSHLVNTIAYMFRHHAQFKRSLIIHLDKEAWETLNYSATTGAEMASYYAEEEGATLLRVANALKREESIVLPDKMVVLIKEAQERKLELPVNVTMYVTVTRTLQNLYQEAWEEEDSSL